MADTPLGKHLGGMSLAPPSPQITRGHGSRGQDGFSMTCHAQPRRGLSRIQTRPTLCGCAVHRIVRLSIWCWTALAIAACTTTVANVPPPAPAPVAYHPVASPPPPTEHKTIVASASWYGPGFDGHKTATGERFSSNKMTAAAKGLPLGSHV